MSAVVPTPPEEVFTHPSLPPLITCIHCGYVIFSSSSPTPHPYPHFSPSPHPYPQISPLLTTPSLLSLPPPGGPPQVPSLSSKGQSAGELCPHGLQVQTEHGEGTHWLPGACQQRAEQRLRPSGRGHGSHDPQADPKGQKPPQEDIKDDLGPTGGCG